MLKKSTKSDDESLDGNSGIFEESEFENSEIVNDSEADEKSEARSLDENSEFEEDSKNEFFDKKSEFTEDSEDEIFDGNTESLLDSDKCPKLIKEQ